MANEKISTFKVAATYIGTVVGAGFASGQEVLQFFGYLGLGGILGLIVVAVLFAFFGFIVLDLGRRLQAKSHVEVVQHAGGPWVGKAVDYIITFFLFGALTAMAAGAGAIFEEQFGLSPLLGNGLMVAAALVTVMAGIGGVITAISFVVPLLLVAVLGVCFYTLWLNGFAVGAMETAPWKGVIPFWPLAALIYVSYNMVMAVAVLAPLGQRAGNRETLRRGAIWGGVGLGVGAVAILLALLVNLPEVARFDIPMVYIANQISPVVTFLFSIVLFAEIYTTAVGCLYGFVARITDPEDLRARNYIVATGLAAFVASQLGFTALVKFLYPAVGYAGLLLLGGLVYGFVKERFFPVAAYKKIPGKGEDKG
ncbi:MAG: YkvI family membrane protein [Thermincolia bacterium]